jgi:NAD(P)-dependent dehydrogenase (short-subunit alcohol dehydrogenase family)
MVQNVPSGKGFTRRTECQDLDLPGAEIERVILVVNEDLTGRRALVTGGSRGTGAAVVRRLRQAGATVLTTARTQPGGIDESEHFIVADVATVEGVQRVLDVAGNIDILVHVAGGSHASAGGFATISDETWDKELAVTFSPPSGSTAVCYPAWSIAATAPSYM